MDQKPSDVLPLGFPAELAAEAFVHSGEAAWRPRRACLVIGWLAEQGYAVLGTEVWLPQQDGIQSLPYFQNVDRERNEDWNSFVARAKKETTAYLLIFEKDFAAQGAVYINLTWVSEPEFRDLKAI